MSVLVLYQPTPSLVLVTIGPTGVGGAVGNGVTSARGGVVGAGVLVGGPSMAVRRRVGGWVPASLL